MQSQSAFPRSSRRGESEAQECTNEGGGTLSETCRASEDATGSVSVFASALAKQTEEQTQEFMQKEEEAAKVREERRVEKAQKASEKAEQENMPEAKEG